MADLGAIGALIDIGTLNLQLRPTLDANSILFANAALLPAEINLVLTAPWDASVPIKCINLQDVIDDKAGCSFAKKTSIASTVVDKTGQKADLVVVRDWNSKAFIEKAAPNEQGEWNIYIPPGTYDITYLKSGFQPVCHGPYTIA